MSERVLGFKEKDTVKKTIKGKQLICIPENKLVYVVSVKWLEKYIKDYFWSIGSGNICTEDDFLKMIYLQAVTEEKKK